MKAAKFHKAQIAQAYETLRYYTSLFYSYYTEAYYSLMMMARSQYERLVETPEFHEHPVCLSPLVFLFPELQTQLELPF